MTHDEPATLTAELDRLFANLSGAARPRRLDVAFSFDDGAGTVSARISPTGSSPLLATISVVTRFSFERLAYEPAKAVDRWVLATTAHEGLEPPSVRAAFTSQTGLAFPYLRRSVEVFGAFFDASLAPNLESVRVVAQTPASERGEPGVGWVSVVALLSRNGAADLSTPGVALLRLGGAVEATLAHASTDDATHHANTEEARRGLEMVRSAPVK